MDRRAAARKTSSDTDAEKLSPLAHSLTILGMSVSLALFVVGIAGVLVLLDASSETTRFPFVSESPWFADFWKRMTEKNPFFTTIFVNGGMVVSIFFGRKLMEHRKALAAEAKRRKAVKAKKKQ